MKPMNNRGFSLLEVLITVLLITIGLLGMLGMQGRAIQYSIDSVERTQAATLANELLEIIRATPGGILENNSPFLFNSLPASANGTCLEIDQDDLLEDQVGCWARKARNLLPGADTLGAHFRACISSTPGVCDPDGAALEVRLAWDATGEGCLDASADELGDTLCTFTFRTQI